MSTAYLALLRGINVGGRNVIRMADLRACLTDLGAADVVTYIQSGNVLFDGGDRGRDAWVERIESALAERFDYAATIVLRSREELRAIVAGAPPGFGTDPDRYRSDVVFLRDSLTATRVLDEVVPREGVDTATAGDGVVYFERLIARAAQSHLAKVVGLPIYQQMTIRNWRTTTVLLSMMDERTR